MRLIFLGPPGVGKGTQAKMLSKSKSVPHISTGDMLRASVASGSDLGKNVKAIIDAGQLVPDDLIIDIIKERVIESDCSDGFILDGFPRTLEQASAFTAMMESLSLSLDAVVYFAVSDEQLERRLVGRRGSDNRVDDSAEVQKKRMKVYKEQTLPLVDYYENQGLLCHVESSGTIEEVRSFLEAALSN